ncbi:MAG: polysaccharide deacetylase family protein [Clostridiales bacterium]|nr:polysaccharide deacetylase family protein [Clostridiales bacterium]
MNEKSTGAFLRKSGAFLVLGAIILFLLIPLWCSFTASETQHEQEFQTLTQNIQFPNPSPNQEIGVTESIMNNDPKNAISIHYPVLGLDQIDRIIKEKINDILSDYQNNLPDDTHRPAEFSSSLWVDYSSYIAGDQIASIVFTVEKNDSTMAHPDVYILTMTFDLESQALLSLSDILEGEYLLAISDYVREYFMQTEPYAPLTDTELFSIGSAPVQGNFLNFTLNDTALTVYFQKYQIFPGYFGIVSVSIPYENLKGYLKIDTDATLLHVASASAMVPPQQNQPVQGTPIDPNRPVVALTFDDGPHPKVTPKILDILKQNKAKATFFVVGNRVDSYASALQREYAEGHEIGNHTYSHPRLIKLNTNDVLDQANRTDQRIANLTSYTPKLLRPPYGEINDVMRENIQKPFVLWSIDTQDWQTQNKNAIVKQVMGKVKDGDIILMHDIYPSTAEACAQLIPALSAQGYQFVTVSELLAQKQITPVAGRAYRLAK